MSFLKSILKPFDYSAIDLQIAKIRQLVIEYKKDNVSRYGEYHSGVFCDVE